MTIHIDLIHIAFLLQNAFYFSNASISETAPAENAELFIEDTVEQKIFKKLFNFSTLLSYSTGLLVITEKAVNTACVRKIFAGQEQNIFHENNCKAHL